jgi:hypothetical protein
MVKINENLILNESYILKAELSRTGTEQILTLLVDGSLSPERSCFELVLKDGEAWALWEYLSGRADRC